VHFHTVIKEKQFRTLLKSAGSCTDTTRCAAWDAGGSRTGYPVSSRLGPICPLRTTTAGRPPGIPCSSHEGWHTRPAWEPSGRVGWDVGGGLELFTASKVAVFHQPRHGMANKLAELYTQVDPHGLENVRSLQIQRRSFRLISCEFCKRYIHVYTRTSLRAEVQSFVEFPCDWVYPQTWVYP